MKLQQRSNAWCVAQPKDAALFFERVHILEGALLEGYEDVEALRAHGNITVKDTLTTVEPGLFILSPVLSPVLRAMAESLFASQGKEFPPAPLSLSRDDPHYSAPEALWVHVVAVRTGVAAQAHSSSRSALVPRPQGRIQRSCFPVSPLSTPRRWSGATSWS